MKHHLSHLAQILAGLAFSLLIAGPIAAGALPVWLVQLVAPVLVLALLFCLSGLGVLFLLWAGMVLQQREHDRAQIRAPRKESAAKGAPFKTPAHKRPDNASFRRRPIAPVADGDAVSALVHLGYSNARAAEAVLRAAGELGAGTETGALIRQALKGMTA